VNRLAPTLALFVAWFALAPTATQAATAIWIGPENGNWSDPANWSTGAVPGSIDLVIIDNDFGRSSSSIANTGTRVNALQVDEGDELTISVPKLTSSSTQVAGRMKIAGGVIFETDSLLNVSHTGELLLSTSQSRLAATSNVTTLWWNQGSIRGAGVINPLGKFYNDGVIDADVSGELLDVFALSASNLTLVSNSGLAKASKGGRLRFKHYGGPSVFVKQSPAGRIEATPLSTVTLDHVQLEGGVLAAIIDDTGSGIVEAIDTTFRNVTTEGTIQATRATLAGEIKNTGKWQFLEEVKLAEGTIELTGGGIVQFSDPLTATVHRGVLSFSNISSLDSRILRNVDNTIRGTGSLSLAGGTLENRGLIESGHGDDDPQPAQANRYLSFGDGNLVNAGIIRSTQNRPLGLGSVEVLNALNDDFGIIEALPGGRVDIWGTTISGGTLRAVQAEEGSVIPDGRFTLTSQDTHLSNLRLEGNFGSNTSETTLSGRIVVDGGLQLRNVTFAADTELVGGEVLLGDLSGQIRQPSGPSSWQMKTLTLNHSTLRLHEVSSATAQYLKIDNRGTIVASSNKVAILTGGLTVRNSGLIHAEAGAKLSITGIETPSGATDAELRVEENASITTSRLAGGRVVSIPGSSGEASSGVVIVSGSANTFQASVENVANFGRLHVTNGSFSGRIENSGIVELSSYSVEQFGALLQFAGNGELRLNAMSLRQPVTSQAVVLVNGHEHTIRTHGNLAYSTGVIINDGVIQADTGTLSIQTGSGGSFVQKGTLRTIGAHTLSVSASQPTFNNYGVFEINTTGTISITTNSINNLAGSDILADGTLSLSRANLANLSGATIRGGGAITGTGDTTINQSILTNHGLVAPGSTVGDLQIRGNFVQSATGVLEIDVTGFEAGEFDQLIIETISTTSGGLATLAGTLDFNFASELIPMLGDELVVLTAKQVTGMFDTIEGLPTLAAGLDWQIDYLPTMVMATVIGLTPPNLAGDFNGDGFVNLADYTVWRDGLDGNYTASDYDLWKQNFGRSIHDPAPEATSPASVPEPATALLALVLACLPMLARRAWR
jgi:hypothetical protein